MNYYTKETLLSSIGDATNLIELSNKNEGSIIISEYGGRSLGLFPQEESFSLLWINPEVKRVIKTRDRAIGGDRYWISPERDFFYKDPKNFKDWFCPSGLDPGNYEILASSETSCTVSSGIFVVNQRTKQGYQGEITRQFTVIREPIKTGVNYCGVEILDDCIFYRPKLQINGWSLACIISGGPANPGTVLVPTKSDPKPLSYFRMIPSNRLKIGENHLAFKIDVDEIYKLAIRPEDINYERKSKIGYIIRIPDLEDYGLLIKLSDDIPRNQEGCFDVARDNPNSEIGVIQSYNSESPNKPLLNYGEIELQLNPFKTIDNASHGKAKHQLIGYISKKEEILDIIEKYLGIDNPFLF